MPETAISVEALMKRFGSFTAVDHVDFTVDRGSIFGLLGANGAGKTTTIRILCGLLGADSGQVKLAGTDVLADPETAKRNIGYMSQRFSLYRDLSVDENLEFFGGLYGVPDAATADGRRGLLAASGLEDRREELAGNLPGGVAQRLALACAMAHRPAVLFLDEPTAGVDPASRRRFWDLIHAAADAGTTVVVTTHYLDEAEYCDRLVLMHAGRIAAEGSPDELKRRIIPGVVLELSGDGTAGLEDVLGRLEWVVDTSLFGDALHVQVQDGMDEAGARRHVRDSALAAGMHEPAAVRIVPSLEDVFLRVIDASGGVS